MKPKHKRMAMIGGALGVLAVAAVLVLSALEQNIVFFHSPSDVAAKKVPPGKRFRIGGLVVKGSVQREGKTIAFRVTDGSSAVRVAYTGILPDLFREGQGVVANGTLTPDGTFRATEILAKHDENYMPREVADALKKSGHWKQSGTGKAGGAKQ
ncbi:MAG TPA: cytochrome c maturation protein CcmE [Alphaproteobacteria bacterium]|nr:cytochrome c maturation protein CcmE [Alphaproteobacteria bacterium]